nr:unnamed protein product [Callosobruchus chinensis]
MMKRLNDSRQWILLIPTETTITLSCEKGEEVIRVLGSYLAEIPVGCTLQLNEDLITNQEPISIGNQPILFPNIDVNISLSNSKNFSLHLDQGAAATSPEGQPLVPEVPAGPAEVLLGSLSKPEDQEGPEISTDLTVRWEAPLLNPEVAFLLSPAEIKKDKFLLNIHLLGKDFLPKRCERGVCL